MFVWRPYGKSGLFETELVIGRLLLSYTSNDKFLFLFFFLSLISFILLSLLSFLLLFILVQRCLDLTFYISSSKYSLFIFQLTCRRFGTTYGHLTFIFMEGLELPIFILLPPILHRQTTASHQPSMPQLLPVLQLYQTNSGNQATKWL